MATGGCTFNGVVYGAGGTSIPTLSSPTVVTCGNTSADPTNLTSAMGSGGTSGSHKEILIEGTQCDMTTAVNVPSYTDVQCQNSSTVIYNPNGTISSCPSSGSNASFETSGTTNTTFTNCTYNGVNTLPPFYPDRNSSCSSLSMPLLIESANNVTFEDNLVKNTTGQAAVEAYGGSTSTPAASNITMNYNTFDNCALYGPDADNVTNSIASHNYVLDCRLGNELDTSTQRGSYQINYSYDRRRTGYGYNYSYSGCGGPSTLDAYCAFQTPSSCSMTGNILDAAGTVPSGGCSSTYGSESGLITFGSGNSNSTYSQNYVYDWASGGSGSCDSISSGCTVGTPPNPAPSGP